MSYLSKTTISFTDALERINNTSVGFFEVELPEMRYAGGHSMKIGMDTHELSPQAWSTLCGYLMIHHSLPEQLGKGLGGLVFKQLNNIKRRSSGAPENIRLAYDDRGKILSITAANLVCLSNSEIIPIIKSVLPSNIISQTLYARLEIAPTEFELTYHTEQLSTEPRKDDVLYGGISIRHSQAGTIPTVVLSYIYRLVCENGMTQRVCLNGRPARTRRCNTANSKRAVQESVKEQLMYGWSQLHERLDGIQELTKHKLDADRLPEALRRRWSINKKLADEIARALQSDELGRTYTEYDLVNALSRVATHSQNLAPRYRRHLSLAAGMFAQRHVHQCPTCGNWSYRDGEN
ncbi:MAG: hypothetical protein ABIG61_01715 [Planctomycetota bacterium]